jgi:glycosyltransferase involved in cell wall biosynthesis
MIYPALAGKANTVMKVLQILPEMNAGGVERGTLEIGRYLVHQGHEALVVSNGGRLVAQLETAGVRHIALPVHRKRLGSLFQVRPFRRLLETERPDILHIRSRVPGWIAWLAWRKLNPAQRPTLVSTVHGFYSVNAYSAIMTRGERVIAVSESIREYITANYPRTPKEIIRVIPRGIEPAEYPRGFRPDPSWFAAWQKDFPHLAGKRVLTLPGRITRLKGHEDFLRLIAALIDNGEPMHGLIVGDVHPKKREYLDELRGLVEQLKLSAHITFTGHRSDLREILSVSDVVYSLSTQPESFGRTTLEALALGRPVVAYDHGGVGEQLRQFFPEGRVTLGNAEQLRKATRSVLHNCNEPRPVREPFTLAAMCCATLGVYGESCSPSTA